MKLVAQSQSDYTYVENGVIGKLDVKPGKTATVRIPFSAPQGPGEWLLNIDYTLKKADGVLPAGHVVAREQLRLTELPSADTSVALAATPNSAAAQARIVDNDAAFLIVKGNDFSIDFSRDNGFMSRYNVGGSEMLYDGAQLTPNFWRAPTDNDYGAGLYQVELLDNLDQVPTTGAVINISVAKPEKAPGFPVRAYAIFD